MTQIFLLEDDQMIASGLTYALEQEGYLVTHSTHVRDAKKLLSEQRFDLAILDMQLPDGIGFEAREAITDSSTGIIFLTVVDDEGNIIRAFEGGADDYITKPFRLGEFLARVKRTLLNKKGESISLLHLGDVQIDVIAGKAYIGSELLDLTPLEYRLLVTFANHKGQILTRAQILESLWDSAGNFVEDNTLTVYMKRLREKLGDAVTIDTIRGVGYRVDS